VANRLREWLDPHVDSPCTGSMSATPERDRRRLGGGSAARSPPLRSAHALKCRGVQQRLASGGEHQSRAPSGDPATGEAAPPQPGGQMTAPRLAVSAAVRFSARFDQSTRCSRSSGRRGARRRPRRLAFTTFAREVWRQIWSKKRRLSGVSRASFADGVDAGEQLAGGGDAGGEMQLQVQTGSKRRRHHQAGLPAGAVGRTICATRRPAARRTLRSQGPPSS
jgi:hypothetical protein